MSENSKGCSCGSGCCTPEAKKLLTIDFLYLDLDVCERCQSAEGNLEQALQEVSGVLESAGYQVVLNKIKILTDQMAIQHHFLSSPTIRMNGRDIDLEVQETPCKDCGDLCGDTISCRSWVYDGVAYEEPPKEMIVNAMMKAVYGSQSDQQAIEPKYILPQNLKIFFNGIKTK